MRRRKKRSFSRQRARASRARYTRRRIRKIRGQRIGFRM